MYEIYQVYKQTPRGERFFFWAENNLNISSVNNRAFCVLSSKYFENEDNKYRSEQRKNAGVIGLSKVDIQI